LLSAFITREESTVKTNFVSRLLMTNVLILVVALGSLVVAPEARSETCPGYFLECVEGCISWANGVCLEWSKCCFCRTTGKTTCRITYYNYPE